MGDEQPLPGTPLLGRAVAGKLRIVSVLGRGSAAVVYRAEHAELGKAVALKVLDRGAGTEPGRRERFERLMESVSGIEHQHVADQYGFGIEAADGLTYVMSELLEGRSLATLLGRIEVGAASAMPIERASRLMIQVLSATAAAHNRGVVHGDLSPSNIFLISERSTEGAGADFVKVTDFGLRVLDTAAGAPAGAGAVEYLAPEVLAGAVPDVKSDIYSAAMILHQLVSAESPRPGAAPRPREISGLDPRLRGALELALADHQARCPNAETFRRALVEVAGPARAQSTGATPASAAPARPRAATRKEPVPRPRRSSSSHIEAPQSGAAILTDHTEANAPPPRHASGTARPRRAGSTSAGAWIMLALAVLLAAVAAIGFRRAGERAPASELVELLEQKKLPASESYVFDHWTALTTDGHAEPLLVTLLALRRTIDGDLASFNEDETLVPAAWLGEIGAGEQAQGFVLTVAKVGAVDFEGILDVGASGLRTQVRGLHAGNQLLFTEVAVIAGDGASHPLRSTMSAFIDGERLSGHQGPYRRPIIATRHSGD